jgi:PAS domain S-box-containing protein
MKQAKTKKASAGKKKKRGEKVQNKKEMKLRVLILEDNPADAELMERQLKKDGITFVSQRVENKSNYLQALKTFQPDLILADYKLPKFDALQALALRSKMAPQTPFIIVTGTISEEVAVTCMKQGADDYLLKDRLARLGEAVRQAREMRQLQAEKAVFQASLQTAAERWRTTFDSMNDAVCLLDGRGDVEQCNRAMNRLLGLPFKKIIGTSCLGLICGKEKRKTCAFTKMMKTRQRMEEENFWRDRWYHTTVDPVIGAAGKMVGAVHIMTDITERKQAQELQQTTSRRLQLALHSAKAGTWDWNVATGLIEWSPQMFELFGLDPHSNSASFESWRTALHPEDREHAENRIGQALKQHMALDSDYRVLLPGGQVRWINAAGVGVYDDSGSATQMIGICLDITERKRAEDLIRASLLEKEVLLKEIHHRVKNNLQVISGLLTLQAAQSGDERLQRVLKESQSRIWTMALIHQTLYQTGNLADIDMADYIRSLSGNLLSSHAQVAMPPTIIFNLLPLRLVIDKAIPLALIINELVTNVLKHAFPDGQPGEIRIALQERRGTDPRRGTARRAPDEDTDPTPNKGTARRATDEETDVQHEKGTARCAPTDMESAPTYELTVADNGVGLPAGFDLKNQKSLGLQLVTMLARQLDGKLAIESKGGTSIAITFNHNEKNNK